MAGIVNLSVQVDGQQIEQSFATWGAEIETLQPALEQIGDDLRADFALNMAGEGALFAGAFAGGQWAPLAESTVRQRGSAHPILWRSGALGASLAYRGGPGNVFNVGADFLEVGTSLEYARYHQEGAPRAHIPVRRIVGLTWNRRSLIVRRIGDYLRQSARAAGLSMTSGGE